MLELCQLGGLFKVFKSVAITYLVNSIIANINSSNGVGRNNCTRQTKFPL
jgi:hypothetical protein